MGPSEKRPPSRGGGARRPPGRKDRAAPPPGRASGDAAAAPKTLCGLATARRKSARKLDTSGARFVFGKGNSLHACFYPKSIMPWHSAQALGQTSEAWRLSAGAAPTNAALRAQRGKQVGMVVPDA